MLQWGWRGHVFLLQALQPADSSCSVGCTDGKALGFSSIQNLQKAVLMLPSPFPTPWPQIWWGRLHPRRLEPLMLPALCCAGRWAVPQRPHTRSLQPPAGTFPLCTPPLLCAPSLKGNAWPRAASWLSSASHWPAALLPQAPGSSGVQLGGVTDPRAWVSGVSPPADPYRSKCSFCP